MTSCDLDDLDQVFDASSDGYTKGEGSRLTAYLFSTWSHGVSDLYDFLKSAVNEASKIQAENPWNPTKKLYEFISSQVLTWLVIAGISQSSMFWGWSHLTHQKVFHGYSYPNYFAFISFPIIPILSLLYSPNFCLKEAPGPLLDDL